MSWTASCRRRLPSVPAESPLLQVSDRLGFCNLGPRWYLAKWVGNKDMRVFAGLEISNDAALGRSARVSRYLRLPARFSIRPLSENGGTAVVVRGRPQFKIIQESLSGSGRDASPLLWVSVVAVLIAFLVFLSARRTRRRFFSVALGAVVLLAGLYFWGRFSRNRVLIFSPMLYAGDDVLYSLGAVILINLAIVVCAACAYIVRKKVWAWMDTRARRIGVLVTMVALAAGVIIYSQSALRSIALNSGFSLEIYKLGQLTAFCVVVYVSFITLLLSVPLLLQVAAPVLPRFGGRPYEAFSLTGRVIYAVLMATYLVVTAGVLGFQKEQDRMGLLATRLSFDRDIAMELRLRRLEGLIANDATLASRSHFLGEEQAIQNHLSSNYFAGLERDYMLTVRVYNDYNTTRVSADEFNAILQNGVPISDNSRFLYARRDGRPYYVGVFFYLSEFGEVSRLLVRLEPRETRGVQGYAGILGFTPPWQVSLPSGYSYARYVDRDLKAYMGIFPYPTVMDDDLYLNLYGSQTDHIRQDGYTHFFYVVGQDEGVVISRSSVEALSYIMAGILVALLAFLVLSLAVIGKRKEAVFQQSYYKSRISWVLLTSLLLTLLVMALVSVLFVYSRNNSNRQTVMSDKIHHALHPFRAAADHHHAVALRPADRGAAHGRHGLLQHQVPQSPPLYPAGADRAAEVLQHVCAALRERRLDGRHPELAVQRRDLRLRGRRRDALADHPLALPALPADVALHGVPHRGQDVQAAERDELEDVQRRPRIAGIHRLQPRRRDLVDRAGIQPHGHGALGELAQAGAGGA